MMASYSEIAAAAYDAMDRSTSIPEDQFKRISEVHGQACRTINTRLQRAIAWLSKGMRSEAIEECEREPNLLDAVSALDIPSDDTWSFLHDLFNMEVPPAVRFDLANQLNQAYAENAPLKSLQQKHRLLALGQAPISARLQVLRQIAKRDDSNENWFSDIETLERARLGEIDLEVTDPSSQADLGKLNRLTKELRESWQVKVPERLTDRVNQLRVRAKDAAVTQLLKETAKELCVAHGEMDVARARNARQKWEENVDRLAATPGAALLEEVEPAFDWIARQDERELQHEQFEKLAHELNGELDYEEATTGRLERIYNQMSQLDFEIPTGLKQRYQNRLHQLRLGQKRKHHLKLAGIGCLAVAVLYLVYLAEGWRANANRITDAADSIRALADDGLWADAIEKFESLESDVRQSSAVIEAYSIVQRKMDRKAQVLRDIEMQVNEFDEIQISDKLQVEKLQDNLDTLRELRSIPGESVDLEKRAMALVTSFRKLVETTAKQKNLEMRNVLDSVRDTLRSDERIGLRGLDELRARIKRKDHELLDEALKNEASILLSEIDGRKQQIELANEENRRLSGVINAVGNWADYERALSEYSPSIGDDLLSDWKAAIEWSDKLNSSTRTPLLKLKSDEAIAASRLLAGLDTQINCAVLDFFRSAVDLAKTRSARQVGERRKLFRGMPRDNIFVTVHKGQTHYLRQGGVNAAKKPRCTITPIQRLGGGAPQLKQVKVPCSQKVLAAPHCEVAERVFDLMGKLESGDSSWDETYIKIFGTIFASVPGGDLREGGIEPFILYDWLNEAWIDGTSSSLLLKETYGNWGREFKAANVDLTVNWLVGSGAKQSANGNALKALRRLEEMFREQNRSAKDTNALHRFRRPIPRFRWVGVLLKDDSGRWTSGCSVSSRLYAPRRVGDKISIEQIETNGTALVATELSSFGVGAPVFQLEY